MTPRTRPLVVAITLAALAALASCKAKRDEFYKKVFTCDPNAASSCGTTESGRPMVCYSAETLGGTGFCAETCDPADDSMARSGVVCAAVTLPESDAGTADTGAILTECAPSTGEGCPEGLTCYRTSLTEDRGVCLAMPVCAKSADCPQNRPMCAADVVHMAVPPALVSMLAADHLHCLAVGCLKGGTQCPPGEACAGAFLSFGSQIDELCMPRCDLHNACPPNFTCLQDAHWAPGAPSICFPGMLGGRCAAADDCLMGTCTDVGVEFKVCTIPCAHDEECAALNTLPDVYFCAKGHCLTPRPFSGSNCAAKSDCIDSQICVGGTVNGTLKHGECRVPCDADGKCPSRGGLPHVCLGANHEDGCYPSSFATPCATQADCVANFKCVPAAPDKRAPQTSFSSHICTIACTTDADCDANSWTKKTGFCQDGICRQAAGDEGVECDRNAQCVSDRCGTDGTCQKPLSQSGSP